ERAQQVDPRHPVKRIVGERDRLSAMHDPHRVVHLLAVGYRCVKLGGDIADESERDVGEHHTPAIGRVGWIALDDADAVAAIMPLHQVREKEAGRAAADDADVHVALPSRPSRASFSVIISRNCRFMILPTGLNGSSVTTSRRSGSLKDAMFCWRRNAISSSNASVSPGLVTTKAHAFSPNTGSGIATSVATLTFGCV